MNKLDAINLLGGTTASAAKAIGCTSQAVSQWPEPLSQRIIDRVISAAVRVQGKKAYSAILQLSKQAA
jgi:hypothetical protein